VRVWCGTPEPEHIAIVEGQQTLYRLLIISTYRWMWMYTQHSPDPARHCVPGTIPVLMYHRPWTSYSLGRSDGLFSERLSNMSPRRQTDFRHDEVFSVLRRLIITVSVTPYGSRLNSYNMDRNRWNSMPFHQKTYGYPAEASWSEIQVVARRWRVMTMTSVAHDEFRHRIVCVSCYFVPDA